MIILEVAEASSMQWGQGAKHTASDQGVDKYAASAPFGGPDELREVLEDLRNKRLMLADLGCGSCIS
eukprot:6164672-Pyramimonas_sp.AAC.1